MDELKLWLAAIEKAQRAINLLKSFAAGDVQLPFNPQTADQLAQAVKTLGIGRRLRTEDSENAKDLKAEVLSAVRQRILKMPLPVLLQLSRKGLRKMAAQDLAGQFDKREAKRRGGTGGRRSANIQAASHQPLDLDQPGVPDVPAPATLVLKAAHKLGTRARIFFAAIAEGFDKKSAAEVAGVTPRMGREYLRRMKEILRE